MPVLEDIMAPWCFALRVRLTKKKAALVYRKHGQIWSSSFIEDHPSAPEAVAESSQYQSHDEGLIMDSPRTDFQSLQDPSKLIPLLHTEWFENSRDRYFKDEWAGGQFLLYYQTYKMTEHFEEFTSMDYKVSLKSALGIKFD